MKKLVVYIGLLLAGAPVYGQQVIKPAMMMKTAGAVTDFYLDTENYSTILTTDNGTIETFNLHTGKRTHQIQLPGRTDFMGDPVPVKVYSIDKSAGRLLIVLQGNHGFRSVLLLDGDKKQQLIDADKDKMLVKKAQFVDKQKVLMGLMSNELVLFDLEKNKILYTLPISPYTFSDFCLSEDRNYVYTSDESGVVHKIDVLKGNIVFEYSACNVDNIYKLQYRNGTIITAGQDRRVGVYQTITGTHYYLQKDFLVYCVGLNSRGTTAAFTADEENTIIIFDTASKQELLKLTGHQSVITRIGFWDDHTVVSGAEDGYLILWKIK